MKHIIKVNNIQDAKDSAVRPLIAMDSNGVLFAEGKIITYRLPKPANNEICYRTALSESVEPNTNTLLGENGAVLHIISNNFEQSWGGYRMVLDGDLIKIGDNAFYKACKFTDIRFPDTLERICFRGFRQCSDLWMTLDFGSGIKYIDEQAFHGDMIKNLVFPTSLISVGDAFWYSGIRNDDGIIRLPAGISYGCLFANAWNFDTLILEEGITEIGTLFNGIEPSDVKHVILPTTLKTIGDYAFSNNPLLMEINLPTDLQSIGKCAFQKCSGLTSMTIGNNVISLGKGAFQYCSGLSSVTIGNNVASIEDSAFYSCSGLTTVSIGNSVTNIGDSAFGYCYCLTSVTIPNSVTSIKQYAFFDCSSLASVTIGNRVTSIGDCAFCDCCLTTVSIPSSVTNIGEYAFAGLTDVQSITVDSNNQTYDSRNNCNAIIESSTNKLIVGNIDITTIPNTVTTIACTAFAMNEKNTLTNSVDIPASVTAIEKWAFELIPTLTTVTCRATNPPALDALAFEGSSNIVHIYVPAESVETYKAATNWSAFANIIEAIPVE